jgi:hypothetical protein
VITTAEAQPEGMAVTVELTAHRQTGESVLTGSADFVIPD